MLRMDIIRKKGKVIEPLEGCSGGSMNGPCRGTGMRWKAGLIRRWLVLLQNSI